MYMSLYSRDPKSIITQMYANHFYKSFHILKDGYLGDITRIKYESEYKGLCSPG